MLVKQISVFVENKFGRLADIIGILGDNDIDISALSIADTTDFGILRLIVNDPVKAEKALKDNGLAVKTTDVIAVSVEDKPGGLAYILGEFKKDNIGIEYMYAFMGKKEHSAWLVIRVDKPDTALETLKRAGISVIASENIYK